MNVNNFLKIFGSNKTDLTMNLFLEENYELPLVYTFLSELYKRKIIKEKDEKGHFELCSEMDKVEKLVRELAAGNAGFVDMFAAGDVNFTIRLENYVHNGFEVTIKPSATPIEILHDILLNNNKSDTECLFVDPFQLYDYNQDTKIDKIHSAFILQKGEDRIKLDFDTPLCDSEYLGKLYYAGIIPDFIVSIVCEH